MTSLLVLVPCRNEARVIARRLRNLALCEWPESERPHRVVVIDDHSSDGTAAVAARAAAELPQLAISVVAGTGRPGKSAAIARGLAEIKGEELIVLTDADVLFERRALVQLAQAFAADSRLGMACGAQRFVPELPASGAPDPRAPSAAGLYDRLTALVRTLESRFGALVSVHGQCLVWRADLGLAPTPGMAADDLDLMLQARAAGARIERVAGAVFCEEKTPSGPDAEAQALRRARAYVQFLGHARIAELSGRGGAFRRLQGWCYRYLPTAAPWLAPLVALASLAALSRALGTPAAAWGLLALLLLLASPVGRRLIALLRVIALAARAEAGAGMSDVWETARR